MTYPFRRRRASRKRATIKAARIRNPRTGGIVLVQPLTERDLAP